MNQFSNYALEQIEMGNSQYRIIAGLKNYIAEIEDKLSRRNLQIKDLKKRLKDIKDNMWRYSLEYPEDYAKNEACSYYKRR